MTDAWVVHEPAIRLGGFLGVLLAMALWETAAPRRRREVPRLLRWSNNFAIVAIDTIVVRLTIPVLAVGMAVIARDRGAGDGRTSVGGAMAHELRTSSDPPDAGSPWA